MKINEYNSWVIDFYKKRNWYQYDPFIRVGFLTEEVGELSRAIRGVEIGRDRPDESAKDQAYYRENLMEELGDVFDNVSLIFLFLRVILRYPKLCAQLITCHCQRVS